MQQSVDQQNGGLIKFYDGIISFLRLCVANIRKNIFVFLGCILLVFAALYVKFNIGGKKQYDVSFTVTYDELVRKIYGDRLVKINTLIEQKDKKKLKSYLNVPDATINSLVGVYGKNILGEDLTEDLNLDKVPFVVTLRVKDTIAITALQNGIVNYLETGTPYLVSRKAIKMQEVDNELAFIDGQLAMMDSLKRKYNSASYGNTDITSLQEGDKTASSIYSLSYTLYKRKQELIRKKEMPNNLQIIDDAIVPQKDKKPLMLLILASLVGGTVLYAFVAAILIPVFRKN